MQFECMHLIQYSKFNFIVTVIILKVSHSKNSKKRTFLQNDLIFPVSICEEMEFCFVKEKNIQKSTDRGCFTRHQRKIRRHDMRTADYICVKMAGKMQYFFCVWEGSHESNIEGSGCSYEAFFIKNFDGVPMKLEKF